VMCLFIGHLLQRSECSKWQWFRPSRQQINQYVPQYDKRQFPSFYWSKELFWSAILLDSVLHFYNFESKWWNQLFSSVTILRH
jgi:hypothetical protein